jgi:5,10-methenyltetrahydrofolate synthetase
MTDDPRPPSSPPCMLDTVSPLWSGLPPAPGDVPRWRKAMRAVLIEARRVRDPALRREEDARIAACLETLIGPVAGRVISLYWPFRGEPDLRAWAGDLVARGALVALPVVVERARPLAFRAWVPGAPLVPGIWNIPVPAEDRRVTPEVVIAPVVGFDPACFRLGYGGGYFDRTLAVLPVAWRAFGVGPDLARLATIHPQPHDVALHAVVTPSGVTRPGKGSGEAAIR